MSDAKAKGQASPNGKGLTFSAKPFVPPQGDGERPAPASAKPAVHAAPFVPSSSGKQASQRNSASNRRGADGEASACCHAPLRASRHADVHRIRNKHKDALSQQLRPCIVGHRAHDLCRIIESFAQQGCFSCTFRPRWTADRQFRSFCWEGGIHVIISHAICAQKQRRWEPCHRRIVQLILLTAGPVQGVRDCLEWLHNLANAPLHEGLSYHHICSGDHHIHLATGHHCQTDSRLTLMGHPR